MVGPTLNRLTQRQGRRANLHDVACQDGTGLDASAVDEGPIAAAQVFDYPPLLNENQVITQLQEIEVDRDGHVYVLNCHYNSSDLLWVYDSSGQLVAPPQHLHDVGIRAPVGLCVSAYDDSRLYLSSAVNQPDANSTTVYVLSTHDLSLVHEIELHNIGHVTGIAEDPVDGTVGVVEFKMPQVPSESEIQDAETILNKVPFYQACFATIPYGDTESVEAICLSEVSPGTDLALPLSVIWTGLEEGNAAASPAAR